MIYLFLPLILDDIIKQNRAQRRAGKKGQKTSPLTPRANANELKNKPTGRRDRNRRRPLRDNKMMDTTPVNSNNRNSNNNKGGIQKARQEGRRGASVIIRSNSGRPASLKNPRRPIAASSTPGLRQPWEKLPAAPLPAEPLKISIRNELATKPIRRSDMMMDTDAPMSGPSGSYNQRPVMAPYEPRDSLASREEYRIGNRFSTQGMAIDYQLPSGASYDTRPTRRY